MMCLRFLSTDWMDYNGIIWGERVEFHGIGMDNAVGVGLCGRFDAAAAAEAHTKLVIFGKIS